MSRLPTWRRRSPGQAGQVMPLLTMLMFVLLLISGFAIDVGSWYLRANQIQRAADVAALVGAELRGEGASEAEVRAAVAASLASNGFVAADGTLTVDVVLEAKTDVVVTVRDFAVPLYLSKLVLDDISIGRSATATAGGCLGSCETPIVIEPPITRIPASSEGDGFNPLIVGRRIYTLNHHLRTWQSSVRGLVCVDIDTELPCPGYPQTIEGVTSDYSIISHYAPRDEIWYTEQRYSGGATLVSFACHSVATRASCGRVNVGSYPRWPNPSWEPDRDFDHVAAPAHLSNGRIYTMDHELRYHCVDLATRNNCIGYPYRLPASFRAPLEVYNLHDPVTMGAEDTTPTQLKLHPVGSRLYTAFATGAGHYLTCFDTATRAACYSSPLLLEPSHAGATAWVHDTITSFDPGTLAPNGVCLMEINVGGASPYGPNDRSLRCGRLDGSGTFWRNDIGALLPPRGQRMLGTEMVWGDRLFWGSLQTDLTYCIELRTASSCGTRDDNARPYAYTVMPGTDCAIGLGHDGVFFTFSRDLGPCPSNTGTVRLLPCSCRDGTVYWGQARLDPAFLAQFESFDVTVSDPSGSTVLGPVALSASDGIVDLSSVSPGVPYLDFSYAVTLPPDTEWTVPFQGTLVVTERATLRS